MLGAAVFGSHFHINGYTQPDKTKSLTDINTVEAVIPIIERADAQVRGRDLTFCGNRMPRSVNSSKPSEEKTYRTTPALSLSP